MKQDDILKQIQNQIDKSMIELDEQLMSWFKEHAVAPFPVILIINETSGETETFWQVTHSTGINDSAYQIVYSPSESVFGLTIQTISGSTCFLGLYGDLSDIIMNM